MACKAVKRALCGAASIRRRGFNCTQPYRASEFAMHHNHSDICINDVLTAMPICDTILEKAHSHDTSSAEKEFFMIATITLNPAIDYALSLTQDYRSGTVNRTANEHLTAGGKGINVSRIVHALGGETVIYGVLAGMTGTMIASDLERHRIPTQWLTLPMGMNRINIKLEESGMVTEINGRGVDCPDGILDALIEQLSHVTATDVIVLAGSIPPTAPKTRYAELMSALRHTNARFAVDTEGQALFATLPYHPFVVKPNLDELSALFDVRLHDWKETIPYGKRLQEMGAQHVLLSLGGEGALLFTPDRILRMEAPQGSVRNAVGAGDSMLAGFLYACQSGTTAEMALRLAIACGSATAFNEGLADGDTIRKLYAILPEPQQIDTIA